MGVVDAAVDIGEDHAGAAQADTVEPREVTRHREVARIDVAGIDLVAHLAAQATVGRHRLHAVHARHAREFGEQVAGRAHADHGEAAVDRVARTDFGTRGRERRFDADGVTVDEHVHRDHRRIECAPARQHAVGRREVTAPAHAGVGCRARERIAAAPCDIGERMDVLQRHETCRTQ